MSYPLLSGDQAVEHRPLAAPPPAPAPASGRLGGAGTRLLAGPPPEAGWERLADHMARLGALDVRRYDPADLRSMVSESGLLGRGGGQFPTAAKLGTVASRGDLGPVVVVNASEGEPASRKDSVLLEYRPHLVLDGAEVAARAVGATEVVVYAHRARRRAFGTVAEALDERRSGPYHFRLVDAPPRYVAGESSAIASFLSGTGALPRGGAPVAVYGARGRPTLVDNAETVAHLALIARFGPAWWRQAGDDRAPGPTLVTLAGEVASPGTVLELLRPVSVGGLLGATGSGAVTGPAPRAVLLGGYEGTWVDGPAAMAMPLARGAAALGGVRLGCGLVAVLAEGACGIATTARLARWLAGESAGQCGPCRIGLPAIADGLETLATGRSTKSDLRHLWRLTAQVRGRGACGHPSGVVGLVESALETFSVEVREHLRGAACLPATRGFPLPVVRRP